MSEEVIHLREDHDNIGEAIAWCNAVNPRCAEQIAEVTCRECLKTVVVFAAGCDVRLQVLSS